jgi:gliding motility-associated-like protein
MPSQNQTSVSKYSVRNILFCWLILWSSGAIAEEYPAITCLQVDIDGNVTVNWTPPASVGNFSHYEVRYSISPDVSFTSIANSLVPQSLNSYTHITNLPLSNSYYYCVLAWYDDGTGGGFSVSSDTLSTIYLEAEPAQNSCNNCDSAAFLEWNEPWLPQDISGTNLQYQIWTDYPGGNWQLLSTVGFDVQQYLHYVFNCSPVEMNFRIRLVTPNGCEFISNISGDFFRDSVFPSSGIVSSVEVDEEGDAVIEWEQSNDTDIAGYMIYRCSSGATTPIAQVDEEPWQFVDVFAQSASGPVSYSIAAYDVCGNYDTTICYASSYLQVQNYTVCDESIEFSWSPYESWLNTPSYYIVYEGFNTVNDFAGVELTAVDTTNTLNYSDSELVYGGYNIYRVEAVDTLTGFRAFTNFDGTFVNDYAAPANVEIQYASVLNADSVEIKLGLEPTALTFRYELQRLELATDTWEEVLVKDTNVTSELYFTDDGLACDVFSYTYRIIVINSCGIPVDTSNFASTVLLDGQANQQRLVNTLSWTPYAEWQAGVDTYRVYRRQKDSAFELIDELNGGASLFYEDDVSELVETDGDFYYQIEAIENSDGTRDAYTAKSNEVNIAVEPIIWIPNAIVIGGYNEIFKPVISYALVEDYYLVVFSRWGDTIFESRSIDIGWDGTMDGKPVREGLYNYYMTVKDGRGRVTDQFGHITVLNYE